MTQGEKKLVSTLLSITIGLIGIKYYFFKTKQDG